ncbi:class I SAM-dependent methyltransferase [Francisella philomiragia]|uniref:UbiE/COQ5 methyltransferase family protein n=1 Tax=Francisella philomiragia TaxID=28110 RepID=A0A0B6CYY3_9GAMM|nr:class I SAM-dependent methyltransferase [Francisella philomiragia]AJI54045.1 ubiE/COQ5 methyltransferase family protein [Francisella philomiragia]
MIHDEKYWNNFYITNKIDDKPSTFAQYVYSRVIKKLGPNKNMLELGCGNGRDSLFFSSNNLYVDAIDYSKKIIDNLKLMNAKNVNFMFGDFTDLSRFKDNSYDFIYSRFTFHSIDIESERKVLKGIVRLIKPGGLFMLEARTKKDQELPKIFGKDHFRRYLDFLETKDKLQNLGFEILESIESQGLSPYKEEDPFLLRIIAKSGAS